MARVRLYVAEGCPFCASMRDHLRRCGVEFQEVDVTKDKGAAQELLRRGIKAVPAIQLGDEFVVGYNADWIKSKFKCKGF